MTERNSDSQQIEMPNCFGTVCNAWRTKQFRRLSLLLVTGADIPQHCLLYLEKARVALKRRKISEQNV